MVWVKISISRVTFSPASIMDEKDYDAVRQGLSHNPDLRLRSSWSLIKIFPVAGLLFYLFLACAALLVLGLLIIPISGETGGTLVMISLFGLMGLCIPLAAMGMGVSVWSYFEGKRAERKYLDEVKMTIIESESYMDFWEKYHKKFGEVLKYKPSA